MLPPDFLEQVESYAINIYSNLELKIIEEIATRISCIGYANTVVLNNILIAQEMGILYQNIIQTVASYNNVSYDKIQKIFNEAGAKTIKLDDRIYKKMGLNPIPLKQSKNMLQLLNATVKKTNANLQNLCMTTVNTAQIEFYNAINNAYMEINTGVKSYSNAIMDAIEKVSQRGAFVTYPSGHQMNMESAIRMNIVTGVNQTCGKLQELRADELGWDLMEITAHIGARPSHEQWQGKIVSRSGKEGYLSFSDIGYGEATGFKGINCKHDWRPYYEGSSKTYTNKELKQMANETVAYNGQRISKYQATQMQRKMERQIRQDKKDIVGLQGILTSNNEDDKLIKEAKIKLNSAQNDLKLHNSILNDFIQQTESSKDYTRLQVALNTKQTKLGNSNKNNIGGSGKGEFIEKVPKTQIKEKIKIYENDIREMPIEYGILINNKGNVYSYIGDKENLKISDRSLKDVILTHNHPEIKSFGEDDFYMLKDNQEIKELRAVDSEYTYSLKILKKLDITYNEFYKKGLQLSLETGEELQHCIMKKIAEKGYIKYDRKRKK